MKKTLFMASLFAAAVCYTSTAWAEETYEIPTGQTVTYSPTTFEGYTDIAVAGTLQTNNQTISQNIQLKTGSTLTSTVSSWGLGNQVTGTVLLEDDSSITGKGLNFGGEVNLNGHTLTIKDMTDAGVYFRSGSSITGTGTVSVKSRTLQFRDSNITATGVTLDIAGGTAEIRSANATTLAGVTGGTGTLTIGDIGASTLKLAGSGNYTFAGTVKSDKNNNRWLTIEHTGTGTQKFTGPVTDVHLKVSGGTMELSNAGALKDLTVSSGGTLAIDGSGAAGNLALSGAGSTLKLSGEGTALTLTSMSNLESNVNISFADGATLTMANNKLWMNGATLNLKKAEGAATGGTLSMNGILFGFKDSGGLATAVNIGEGTTFRVTGEAGNNTNNGFIIWNKYGHTFNVDGSLVIDHKVRAHRSEGESEAAHATFNVGGTGRLEMKEGIDFYTSQTGVTSLGTINVDGTLAIGGATTGNKATVNLRNGAKVVALDAETSTEQVFTIADNAAITLVTAEDKNLTLNGALSNATASVTVNGGGTLTLGGTDTLKGLEVASTGGTLKVTGSTTVETLAATGNKTYVDVTGDLTVTGPSEMGLNITNLSMGTGSTVTVGTAASHENMLWVNNLTVDSTEGTATTLNANINLGAITNLTLNGVLTMGCTVDLGYGTGSTTLSGSLLDGFDLETEGSLTLFNDVETVTVGGAEYTAPVAASTVFGNGVLVDTDTLKYTVSWNEDKTVTLNVTTVVPEPATATLSLLALAGLAARRRRH